MNRELKALAVGRLVPIKNFDVILQAWEKITIPLQIVGDGPERETLERLCDQYGLNDRVELLGERSDVRDLMKSSDLLVSVSTREGFAYVVLEALQASMVVFSTNTGIASDLLRKPYLLDAPDVNELQEKARHITANFDQAKRDFFHIWKVAREMTIDRMVCETERVYFLTLENQLRDC